MTDRPNLTALTDGASKTLFAALRPKHEDADILPAENAASALHRVLTELGERIADLENRLTIRGG